MELLQQNPPIDSTKSNLNKNCFNFCFVIGKGGFGKVWKVEYHKTKEQFALKEMSKLKIIDKKSEKSINAEREFLTVLNHPFLVNMHYAFQDNDNLYLTMDLLSGGDLRYHISRYRRFSEEQTRFFIASLVLSLNYIHKNNVIHRDIKPENLVLDDKGYVRVTDFGIAKENCPDNSSETSGTPGYMSPEVMKGKNHSFPVDFFAVGVIGYEFMRGRRPYYGHNRKEIRDQMISKQAMIKTEEIQPGWSAESVDFINQLLLRKPELRLGSSNGATDLMDHPWLKYYPWKELEKKTLLAPFIPEKRDNFDKRYCEGIDKITEETKFRYQEIVTKDKNLKKVFANYYYNKEEIIKKELKKKDNRNNNKPESSKLNTSQTILPNAVLKNSTSLSTLKRNTSNFEDNSPSLASTNVPFIHKIPLPHKSRQDNSKNALNNHIQSQNNSARENNSNTCYKKIGNENMLIKKKIEAYKNDLIKKMNNSNSIQQYNDSFLNKIINNNSCSHRNDIQYILKNPLVNNKVTLLKYHSRSSSVLNNNQDNIKKSSHDAKIESISHEQSNSTRNAQELLNKRITLNKINNESIKSKSICRVNSASKLSRSSSLFLLNKKSFVSMYPDTKY